MSLVVNHNLMAANTARNLNAHYSRLATSTQRLSSGLRINSAADDAAGLAIRELQRADIAALQQGARNANDAISMIQVADGALGIIDEKLIRMKELAEQAATGTYDSTQRLMIESEYQAMASEITRIANATDFNGMKLLDGTLDGEHDGSKMTATGKMKIHFGTGNDSAEDYYYITAGECTAQAFGLGSASTWDDVQNRAVDAFTKEFERQIKDIYADDPAEMGKQLAFLEDDEATGKLGFKTYLNDYFNAATDPANAFDTIKADENWADGTEWAGNSSVLGEFLAKTDAAEAKEYYNGLRTSEKQKLDYYFGQAALTKMQDEGLAGIANKYGIQVNMNECASEAEFNGDYKDFASVTAGMDDAAFTAAIEATKAKVGDMDAAGMTIETQEDAQMALEAINKAIEEKDKIRAHLGAVQNRLENTVSNLNIQAENLQAAESRISDVDVATEMTQFVRNQILTQSAVAMLGQANSLPQMAMQLIGG